MSIDKEGFPNGVIGSDESEIHFLSFITVETKKMYLCCQPRPEEKKKTICICTDLIYTYLNRWLMSLEVLHTNDPTETSITIDTDSRQAFHVQHLGHHAVKSISTSRNGAMNSI